MRSSPATVEEVKWQDIRIAVAKVNSSLAKIIDEFDPGKGYHFLKIRYPFCSNIVNKGVPILPTPKGDYAPLHDNAIPERIRNQLRYSSIPLGLWLNTNAEVYVELDDRTIPLNVFRPGSIFGLWEVLDTADSAFSQRIWSIAAGARSLFLLPKITDNASHTKLEKACKLRPSSPPKTLFSHAQLFAQIAKSPAHENAWYSEILYFSSKWFEEKTDDKGWLKLQHHLLKNEWTQSIFWRNKVTFALIRQSFAAAQASKNLKPNPYLIDTVMYLMSLGIGASPGFEPAVNNELSGPISIIQKAFIEAYGLKHYVPTIMQPSFLQQTPIYYSMQLPTLLASSPKFTKSHSVLDDLRMVKRLLESLQEQLKNDNKPIYNLISNLRYEFFHSEPDSYLDIKSTLELPKSDPRLIYSPYTENRIFCENTSFMRGCVRISAKENH